jgi:hypothetical protein
MRLPQTLRPSFFELTIQGHLGSSIFGRGRFTGGKGLRAGSGAGSGSGADSGSGGAGVGTFSSSIGINSPVIEHFWVKTDFEIILWSS